MDGILVIDKPVGPTSADVVDVVKRRLRCKAGHLGTLDPFASGVLPLCLGEATKVARLLHVADKQYQGRIQLGVQTDTGDPTGSPVAEKPVPEDVARRLPEVVQRLQGRRLQVPPMYSAVKRNGVPLYKLARHGVTVHREPRWVEVQFDLLEVGGTPDCLYFRVTCSKGTYVRVLAEEIGEALGTVAHLAELRRTRFGPFSIEDAIHLTELETPTTDVPVIPIEKALPPLRQIVLVGRELARARRGDRSILRPLPPGHPSEVALLVDPHGRTVALIEYRHPTGWHYLRVLLPRNQQGPP